MKFEILMQEERAKGRAEGHASGLAEGEEHGKLSILVGLMQTASCSAEEALKMCGVPEAEWQTYLDLLAKENEEH